MDTETNSSSEPALDTPASEVSSGASTIEDVEAFWRNRTAGKERAWNAEASVLRGENESLKQRLTATPPTNGAAPDRLAEELAVTQRQLEAERQARVVDQRKLKYPALANTTPNGAIWTAADDAELAKFNALAEDGNSGTFYAPTNPRKAAPAAAKKPEDLTDDEFKVAFRQAADALEQSRRENQ